MSLTPQMSISAIASNCYPSACVLLPMLVWPPKFSCEKLGTQCQYHWWNESYTNSSARAWYVFVYDQQPYQIFPPSQTQSLHEIWKRHCHWLGFKDCTVYCDPMIDCNRCWLQVSSWESEIVLEMVSIPMTLFTSANPECWDSPFFIHVSHCFEWSWWGWS